MPKFILLRTQATELVTYSVVVEAQNAAEARQLAPDDLWKFSISSREAPISDLEVMPVSDEELARMEKLGLMPLRYHGGRYGSE